MKVWPERCLHKSVMFCANTAIKRAASHQSLAICKQSNLQSWHHILPRKYLSEIAWLCRWYRRLHRIKRVGQHGNSGSMWRASITRHCSWHVIPLHYCDFSSFMQKLLRICMEWHLQGDTLLVAERGVYEFCPNKKAFMASKGQKTTWATLGVLSEFQQALLKQPLGLCDRNLWINYSPIGVRLFATVEAAWLLSGFLPS